MQESWLLGLLITGILLRHGVCPDRVPAGVPLMSFFKNGAAGPRFASLYRFIFLRVRDTGTQETSIFPSLVWLTFRERGREVDTSKEMR